MPVVYDRNDQRSGFCLPLFLLSFRTFSAFLHAERQNHSSCLNCANEPRGPMAGTRLLKRRELKAPGLVGRKTSLEVL